MLQELVEQKATGMFFMFTAKTQGLAPDPGKIQGRT